MSRSRLIFEKEVNGEKIKRAVIIDDENKPQKNIILKTMDMDDWRLTSEKGKPVINEIRAIRAFTKMSRPEFCKAIFNLPIRTLENWESGIRKPPEYVIQLIICRLEQLEII